MNWCLIKVLKSIIISQLGIILRVGCEYQYHNQFAELLIFLNRTEDFAGLNLINDDNKKDVKDCIERINIKAQSKNIKSAKTISY